MNFDAVALLGRSVNSVDGYKQWACSAIRPAFPHQILVSLISHLHAGGASTADCIIGVNFPTSYLNALRNRAGGAETPIMRRFVETREPQLFEANHPWPDVPAKWFQSFQEHDMQNVAAHGLYDTERCVATYHSFYRIPGRLGPVHVEALKKLVPVMHEVLCRVAEPLLDENLPALGLASLSSREQDIAKWVRLGKSNEVIATISGLSENTIKHHLTSIFRKLAVDSRAELIHRLAEDDTMRRPRLGNKIL